MSGDVSLATGTILTRWVWILILRTKYAMRTAGRFFTAIFVKPVNHMDVTDCRFVGTDVPGQLSSTNFSDYDYGGRLTHSTQSIQLPIDAEIAKL